MSRRSREMLRLKDAKQQKGCKLKQADQFDTDEKGDENSSQKTNRKINKKCVLDTQSAWKKKTQTIYDP